MKWSTSSERGMRPSGLPRALPSVSPSRILGGQVATGIRPALRSPLRCPVSLFNPRGKGTRCIHPQAHWGPHVFGSVQ